jgi:hypothetical protein
MYELVAPLYHCILHFVLVAVVHHTDDAEHLLGGFDDGGFGYAVAGLDGDLQVVGKGGGRHEQAV